MRGSPRDSGRRGSTRLALVCILTALPAFAPTAAAQNVNYGAAYDAIDRTAVYVSTWFDDAKATSVRRDDGSVDTIIEDGAANVLARAVHRGRSLDASVTGLGRLAHYTATLDSSSSYATDWFNKRAVARSRRGQSHARPGRSRPGAAMAPRPPADQGAGREGTTPPHARSGRREAEGRQDPISWLLRLQPTARLAQA
jgi:hypothetical protein